MKFLRLFALLSIAVFLTAGTKLKVMVVDTGLDFNNPDLSKYVPKKFLSKKDEWNDTHGHGTHVFGLVVKNACPEVEVIPCKYYGFDDIGYNNLINEIKCLDLANAEGVMLINQSGGGDDPAVPEKTAIKKLIKRGGIYVAAAGNNGRDLDKEPYYPACYFNKNSIFQGQVIAVGNLFEDGTKVPSSNYAPWISWEMGWKVMSILPGGRPGTMSGTSQACAVRTGKIVEQWCKTHQLSNIKNGPTPIKNK